MPDKTDFLSFMDFFRRNYRRPTGVDVLLQAFRVFDVTDSGTVSLEVCDTSIYKGKIFLRESS